MTSIPALEIGGTHVTGARVDAASMRIVANSARRRSLDGGADAENILQTIADTANLIADGSIADWGIAVPAPFDYSAGVAWYEGVGKFDSLRGVDVGARLLELIQPTPTQLYFLNDADAFVLGEWVSGALAGTRRCAGLTLGTGIGSGFVVDGTVVLDGPGVPPEGSVHQLLIDGRPLEETVSRRAIRRAYAMATRDADVDSANSADVGEIAQRAREGSIAAIRVIDYALHSLGAAIGPYLHRFEPEAVVIGGAMSASWSLFEPSFVCGCADVGVTAPPTQVSRDSESASLSGAAYFGTRRKK